MSSIKIITDSHSSIGQKKAQELGISVLPMPFTIDGEDYLEGITLSWDDFLAKLKAGADVSTSQPSPEAVLKLWDQELKHHDQILYIPISSGLSGSCSTATMLAQEEPYLGKVFVVDNGRVATPMYCTILDALELVRQGFSAPQIQQALEAAKAEMTIYIAVDSLKYLKRGGRISASASVMGTILNIKPILQFDIGILQQFKNCRGMKTARRAMIEALKHDLNTKFRESFEKGELHLLAASSADDAATADWVAEIQAAFPGMDVLCEKLAFGITCHIGPDGLGIGCSCHPSRPD